MIPAPLSGRCNTRLCRDGCILTQTPEIPNLPELNESWAVLQGKTSLRMDFSLCIAPACFSRGFMGMNKQA